MRPKQLIAATVIPDALYVERAADRQLRRTIREMGRPAYVLVSRQMGKTNLLLASKRTMEPGGYLFVYVDFSTPLPDAQACFRNIVDTALGAHPRLLSGVRETLEVGRVAAHSAHKEHERELRLLLQAVANHRIVVVLDEIDALTRAPYSDEVFAQIRSTYFSSRVNYPEFARLTYVLSGVAEPADLIRNPKLSPFNIGEKIYLDDFSLAEVASLLSKAAIAADEATAARIHYWTSGHPRMTWDMSSQLEDQLIAGTAIGPPVVDAVVKRLYLTRFDVPPLDHIRSLVEGDRVTRDALVQLAYGRGQKLDDASRSRLYLAGIIGANLRKPQIKNRAIEIALSPEWLQDLDRRRAGLLEAALDSRRSGAFEHSVALLADYLSKSDLSAAERSEAEALIASSYYHLADYRKALEHYSRGRVDRDRYPDLHFKQAFEIGLCHFFLGEGDKAAREFREIVEHGSTGPIYYEALLNLSGALHLSGLSDQALDLNKRAIAELSTEVGSEQSHRGRLMGVAHFNVARLVSESAPAEALEHLRAASRVATKRHVPRVLLELARLSESAEERREAVRAVATVILEIEVEPRSLSPANALDFSEGVLRDCLLLALAEDPSDSFARIWAHYRNQHPEASEASAYRALGFFALTQRAHHLGVTLFEHAIAAGLEEEDPGHVLGVFKLLAMFTPADGRYRGEYLKRLMDARPGEIDSADARIMVEEIGTLLVRDDASEAVALTDFLASYRESSRGVGELYFVVADYYLLRTMAPDDARRVSIARRLLRNVVELAPTVELGASDRELIRSEAESVLRQVHLPRRYGRNELVRVRYGDGRIVKAKFKKVERQIRLGSCELLG